MSVYLTGPFLRARVREVMRRAGLDGSASYRYVSLLRRTPRGGGDPVYTWVRAPEYDATHIEITAFQVAMGASLGPLLEVVWTIPGCGAARERPGTRELRPCVVAYYDRATAEGQP